MYLGDRLQKSGTVVVDGVFDDAAVGAPVVMTMAPWDGDKDDRNRDLFIPVVCAAEVLSVSKMRIRWWAAERIRGERVFNYVIGANNGTD